MRTLSRVETYMDELARDTAHMSKAQQESFVALLPVLAKLHRDDATARGVLIIADNQGQTLIRMNADEFEAQGMLHDALPFHTALFNADRPEHLN